MEKFMRIILVNLALVLIMGCNIFPERGHGPVSECPEVRHKDHGPPPHAPAHGYRHKHQHQTLEYNEDAGAYVVVQLPGTYFFDGLYMRLSENGRWVVSADLYGGWRVAVGNEVPYKLKTYKKKNQKKKKHKNKKKY